MIASILIGLPNNFALTSLSSHVVHHIHQVKPLSVVVLKLDKFYVMYDLINKIKLRWKQIKKYIWDNSEE